MCRRSHKTRGGWNVQYLCICSENLINVLKNPAGGLDSVSCDFCVLSGRDIRDELITINV